MFRFFGVFATISVLTITPLASDAEGRGTSAPPVRDNGPGRAAAERIAWDMQSWRSIELRGRIEIENHTGAAHGGVPYSTVMDERYVETATGKRRDELLLRPTTGGPRLYVSYCDGSRCAHTAQDGAPGSVPAQLLVKRGFNTEEKIGSTDRPFFFKYYYVGKKPLYEALPAATYLGTTEVLGRECDRFVFPGVVWAYAPVEMVYDLDREWSIPLRVAMYSGPEARSADAATFIWEAESTDLVDGHRVVLNSTQVMYQPASTPSGGKPTKVMTQRLIVDEIAFDRDYPDADFWPTLVPGMVVADSIENRHYRVADTGGEVELPESAEPPTPTNPARPGGHWTGWASWVGIGFGAAALMAAVAIRLRAN